MMKNFNVQKSEGYRNPSSLHKTNIKLAELKDMEERKKLYVSSIHI